MSVGIDYSNDRAIRGRVFSFERKTGFLPAAPKHQLANARTNRIDRHQRLSIWLKIFIQGLHDQKFAPFERFVFDSGYQGADDACELHGS